MNVLRTIKLWYYYPKQITKEELFIVMFEASLMSQLIMWNPRFMVESFQGMITYSKPNWLSRMLYMLIYKLEVIDFMSLSPPTIFNMVYSMYSS